ncbi:DUF1648 domain-containing protein [Enterococcus gilvus]|uniref:DUF1648 domain-containing protein n=1 Tax=Enterococcus gilvus TaxID=160453 RepID=UPI0036F1E5D1
MTISGYILALILLLLTIFIYPKLPSKVPIHIGILGPDQFSGKSSIFIWPLVLFILSLVQKNCRLDYGRKIISFFLHGALIFSSIVIIKMYYVLVLNILF